MDAMEKEKKKVRNLGGNRLFEVFINCLAVI